MATPDLLPCGEKYTQYSRKGLTVHLARSLLLRQDDRRLRLAYSETGGHAAASKSNGPTIDKAGTTKTPYPYGGGCTQGVQPRDTATSHKTTAPVMG
jgi:hypothetical protein